MEKEGATLYFSIIVAVGILVSGIIISAFQTDIGIPIIILGIFFTILLALLAKNNKFGHSLENLEKVFFFITFAVICISFILLYRPM